MNILRQYDAWLENKVMKLTKKRHPDLFHSFPALCMLKFRNFFSHKDCWAAVIVVVIGFFILAPYINIPIFNFLTIKIETAKIIVDQRTTNIATIISISLVVVGFLINNLAVKSPITFKLLFRKSLLYFTIYLTLSTISCFMILSLARDSLNDFSYTRMVVAVTYMAIIILILIGYLFRKIIYFTDEKMIAAMLKKEMIIESKSKLKSSLINKYSVEMYPTLFENFAEPEFEFSIESLQNAKITFTDSEDIQPIVYRKLVDINIWLIELYLYFKKKTTKDIYFSKLALGSTIEFDNEIIWSNEKPNSNFQKWWLRQCLVTRKIKETVEEDTYRKEFDQKILQLAEESKYQNMELTLEAYFELYDLQMTQDK